MHPLVGYCDRWSARPGERLRFMVSSRDDASYTLRFARHFCADPNPRGPGYREAIMPTPLGGTQPGRFQGATLGSYGRAPALAINWQDGGGQDSDGQDGLSIAATIWPTTPRKGRQSVVSLAAADWSLTLGIDPDGAAVAEYAYAGGLARASTAVPLLERRWYDLALVLDADGTLHVAQRARAPVGGMVDGGEAEAAAAAPPSGVADAWLAAAPEAGGAGEHFNGKLERPTIRRGPATTRGLLEAQRDPAPGASGLVAAWDFSIGIPGMIAADTGPQAAHATLVNLPTRAMTGSNWTGAIHDWKVAPQQYGAIHFHDDDQGELGWAESFALEIPADWPSGFYSAHISNAAGEDRIPFFVRPIRATADVVLVVPTYTYQVYGCHVRPGRGEEIAARARAWGSLTETPDMNPEFGLSGYNFHSDGSGVSITSMRRPMLDTRPGSFVLMDPAEDGSGTSRIVSDCYILEFLERIGIACDVVTDHDVHDEGGALLSQYRLVIAGQHPEYHSDRMMQAFEDHLAGGGRLMYLGGNGFYWRAEPCEAAPHALEIRRAEGGIRVWATEAGESYHAFGGGYGGLWRRIGRPSHRLVGSGFSSQGRHLGFPYRFTEGIRDPRVGFMTVGLDVTPGEAFGDRGFMGGGAAGFELDSADPRYGSPPNVLIVAKGIVIHPDYYPVNEDRLATRHPRADEDWSCADLLFFETPAGGAVFSVGSMTWAGSLPVDDYHGTVARLTANVVRRFIDPAPFV